MLKKFVTLLTNLQLSLECSVRELCGVFSSSPGRLRKKTGAEVTAGRVSTRNIRDAMSARDPFPIPVT